MLYANFLRGIQYITCTIDINRLHIPEGAAGSVNDNIYTVHCIGYAFASSNVALYRLHIAVCLCLTAGNADLMTCFE